MQKYFVMFDLPMELITYGIWDIDVYLPMELETLMFWPRQPELRSEVVVYQFMSCFFPGLKEVSMTSVDRDIVLDGAGIVYHARTRCQLPK